MKFFLVFTQILGAAVICLIVSHCTSADRNKRTTFSTDTTRLVQAVLSDEQLERELLKDFGTQEFKFVANFFVKIGHKFTFSGKAVSVLNIPGDEYQIHQKYPKELYVSVSEIKFVNKDSASVELIFHAGNAIRIFDLKKVNESWKIVRLQKGKF